MWKILRPTALPRTLKMPTAFQVPTTRSTMSGTNFSPLITAHRGYKDRYAENTMAAFKGAVDVDVQCIETDVHLSVDGVVMINHDPSTGRSYDQNLAIGSSTVDQLKQLRNKQDPTQQMLTLKELLEWFVEQPQSLKLMLDVKASNPTSILAVIQRTMLDVRDDLDYWKPKVIFGLWKLNFYQYGVDSGLLNGFEIINITISPTIAKFFLSYSLSLPKEFQLCAISLNVIAALAPELAPLRKELMEPNDVDLYLWTLNTKDDFALGYSVNCKGFITDKPVEAMAAVQDYQDGKCHTYKPHSFFSISGLRFNARFGLFRLFEFLLFNNLLRFSFIAKPLMWIARLLTPGQ